MKKLLYQLSTIFLVGSLISCEKSLMTYEGESNIYFAEAGVMDSRVAIDSSAVSFSLVTNTDSIKKVVVSVLGAPVNYDRAYKLEIDPSSTAVLGTHFEMPENFVIKKNALKDTIPVRLIRTPDMLTTEFSIIFNLLPNENFKTNMKQRLSSSRKVIKCTTKKLMVSDVLLQPRNWSTGPFGPFTRKKLFLICEITGTTPLYMNTVMTPGESIAFGRIVQRYLNEQKDKGNIIYEADGVTVMKMGLAAQ